MDAALLFYGCSKTMKKLISSIFNYLRKEWFLVVMVFTITFIILLFELLS